MVKDQQLHETALSDMVDYLKHINKGVSTTKKYRNSDSIFKRTSDLVLVFPVLVSSSLSVENAVLISKAIERKCASLIQVLFASLNVIDADKDFIDHIKSIHGNLGANDALSLDDFINVMDSISKSSKNESVVIADPDTYSRIMEQISEINEIAKVALNETSINDYRIYTNKYGDFDIAIDTEHRKQTKPQAIKEDGIGLDDYFLDGFDNNDDYKEVNPVSGNSGTKNAIKYANSMDAPASKAKIKSSAAPEIISKEINKSNELMPTLMTVNYIKLAGDNQVPIKSSGVIGIKAKLYPVDSMEIINRVSRKYKDTSNMGLKLIKASTGEISFWKDLVFAFDRLKTDAIHLAKGSKNAKLFNILEKRASKANRTRLLNKNCAPITTLVISASEVEYLKKFHDVDMEKRDVAKNIFTQYNFMGLVIVDESLELAKFLFDNDDNSFEVLSFNALKKEDKDGSVAKVMNIMSKIGR